MAEDINDTVLFEPTGRDMTFEFPELKEYSEFMDLSARELKLVWFIGNRTSPYAKIDDKKKRLELSVKTVYPETSLSRKEVKDMMEGIIPTHLVKAIQKMALFSPSHRLRAKLASEYIFEELLNMLYVDDIEKAKWIVDPDLKKKHADLVIKINGELPGIIKTIESGYGVSDRKLKNENKGKVLISFKNIKDRASHK